MTRDVKSSNVTPPHSIESERAVLGSVLRDPTGLSVASEILRAEQFFIDSHRRVFEGMLALLERHEAVDILTVSEKLRELFGEDADAIGSAYLVELTENCPVTQNIEYYARLVAKYHHLRSIIDTCQQAIHGALNCEGNIDDYVDDLEQKFLAISQKSVKAGIVPANIVVESTLAQIQKNMENGGGLTGIPTGFYELDGLIGGWQRTDLVILAARPGMGKTALILNTAFHAARSNFNVVIFSLEMNREQLMTRIFSGDAKIDSSKLRRTGLADGEFDRLMDSARFIHDLQFKLSIDETPGLTLMELRSRCRRHKAEHELDMIVIDYLQLMEAGGTKKWESREREVAYISKGLKELAKELKVPVIACAQLNRGPDSRPDKRPKSSDLRESGSIEQDADMVMFLYRDEYYNPTSEKAGVAELIVAKNRHGEPKTIELAYLPSFVSFQNLMKS